MTQGTPGMVTLLQLSDERDSLATQLEQMRRERDEARSDRDSMAQALGETRVDLAEARATNAKLHRRAQGVEAGKPEDAETIRRLRREVRAMAKHTGTMAGHLFRAMDMVSSAHRSLRMHEQVAAGMTRERDEARARTVPPTVDELIMSTMDAAVARTQRDAHAATIEATWEALGTIGRGRGVTLPERAAKVVAVRDAMHAKLARIRDACWGANPDMGWHLAGAVRGVLRIIDEKEGGQ